MLIKLTLNEYKAKSYNENIRTLTKENPDLADFFIEVHKIEDKFIPYSQATSILKLDEYNFIETDVNKYENFDGVYVCSLNSSLSIESLTDYQVLNDYTSPLWFDGYGVCDNASQALDYFHNLCNKHSEYMNNSNCIILLTPIFKEDQPESGGWRWHKWGQYIGKFKPKCEYLYDEEGIDFVFCFSIIELKHLKEIKD